MRFLQLQHVTGFAKVAIYLACGIGLLGTIYTTGSFIYTMVKADDLSDVLVTEILELPALAREQAAGPWETENGAVRYRLHKIYGEFSHLNMPRGMVFAAGLRVLGLWALFFLGTVQLARILRDVGRGKAFTLENARRLRIVGYALAGGAIFKLLMYAGALLLFRSAIEVTGSAIPWLLIIHSAFSPGLFLGGIIVIVISEVFRLGNELREEQELTI
ncbi:MAG: DUF2975 domain-containing protein [Candidatus Aminicenantes bacterium]